MSVRGLLVGEEDPVRKGWSLAKTLGSIGFHG